MDFTRYYHIAFAYHRIMNPLSEDVLARIGRLCLPQPGAAVLDIGSGKGYASLLLAREFQARTTLVDVSEQWSAYAHRLFEEHGLAHLATIHTVDADRFLIERGLYRMILCFGTTPVYGGFSEALTRLRDGLTDDGVIAVGEISCEGMLPKPLRNYLDRHDWRIYQMKELLDAIDGNGFERVVVVRSSPLDWDWYMSLQWKAIGEFVRDHPSDPDAATFDAYMREEQDAFLRFQRAVVDWNVFILRKR
jgi:predicted O-methyltransferase YrrM